MLSIGIVVDVIIASSNNLGIDRRRETGFGFDEDVGHGLKRRRISIQLCVGKEEAILRQQAAFPSMQTLPSPMSPHLLLKAFQRCDNDRDGAAG